MAGKKTSRAGRKPAKKGKKGKLPKGFPRKAGSKSTTRKKGFHTVTTGPQLDVWKLQSALRKDKYFARVIRPNMLITNSPVLGKHVTKIK